MVKIANKSTEDRLRKISIIRFIYLYLISAITFIVFLIGAVSIVNLGLKVFVFDIEDDYYMYSKPSMACEYLLMRNPSETEEVVIERSKQAYDECIETEKALEEKRESRWIGESTARELSIGIAQVLVAFPLWIFHWRTIEKDRKSREKKK